jgi:hypothetical protein
MDGLEHHQTTPTCHLPLGRGRSRHARHHTSLRYQTASIAYEQRVDDLYDKYRSQGVQVVGINPNNPKAVRLNELGFTDMTDSFEEMKIRAAFMKLPWPYLYDGETQAVSKTFGAVATPHIFVFDQERKLRYQVAFAATGTPAAEGLPAWPPHDATGDRYLELGPVIEAKAGLKKSACDVLDSVYPRFWGPAR